MRLMGVIFKRNASKLQVRVYREPLSNLNDFFHLKTQPPAVRDPSIEFDRGGDIKFVMETKAKLDSKALGRRVLEAKEDNAHRQYRVDTMALLLQSDWIIFEAVSKMSFGLPLFGGIGALF